ncbi:sulfate adenylyltransferase subunit CysN [Achromobacter spanius]|jgi:bifunctional enzyme CysN/CysC|uniref:Multifunctional fusion protein n=1 Tax=Achromobacter spanius TaxID=217203 RepID=A0AA42IU38_9BURK|nr:sulfate adenylyltransferase subunit CysN [Achromobacter spanius]MDH0735234.1 sulfate adenylyltransferase subunit CysN [Achromobacter spanius]
MNSKLIKPVVTPVVETIESFLESQRDQDLLRFITCGSVDDGKSTLIGRLLWDSKQLFDDQLLALQNESRKYGTQGGEIDFALLVDGLAAEREQGITIDVAYRFFSTARRKFIVADTPGHEQYTRNMITGASMADVAVILVDARQGVLTQTRRHAYLASLTGIRNVVLAINKMDMIGFDQNSYESIIETFNTFSRELDFDEVTAIPLSALHGDNITSRSNRTPWYHGPTLIGYLETVSVAARRNSKFTFPIQWVNRPSQEFRGFCGTIEEGQVSVGDEVRVTRSGQTASVSSIVTMAENLDAAVKGQAVTLTLDKEIDASRGDVMSLASAPHEMTDQFEATIIWMHEESGLVGRSYEMKLSTQWATATMTSIKYHVNVNTMAKEPGKTLGLNDIAVANFALSRPVVFDTYENSKALGGFILVDRVSNATVGAGLIRHTLRRAQNVHRQSVSITRSDRESMNGHKGKVIWLTGLSGAGKSTIANALEVALHGDGRRTYLLDGDNVRQGLNKDLGFTDAERVENIRRVAEVARLMMDAGLVVITAFISPFRREREMARDLIGADNFLEVYVNTSLEVCESRDPKGLYKKARKGELPNLSGIGSPYEPPESPGVVVDGAGGDLNLIVQDLARRLAEGEN